MTVNDLNKIGELVNSLTAENARKLDETFQDSKLTAKTKKEAKTASEWYQAGIDEVYARIREAMLKGGL